MGKDSKARAADGIFPAYPFDAPVEMELGEIKRI